MRAKKAFKNTLWGLIYEAVSLGCGYILPYLVLTSFGSAYNGITSAIVQFLRAMSLLQAGIAGVTTAALYKPLSENDIEQVSVIVKTTESYMRKVAFVFVGFSLLLAGLYPLLVSDQFGYIFTASLVLIISFSSFSQYFFGLAYKTVLSASQNQRFLHIVNMVKTLANTAIMVVLIRAGFGIHAVKLGSAVVFVIAPVFIHFYVKKRYGILSNVKKDNSLISQRWDNFGIQVAAFAANNTNLIVLSIFSNVYEISVYVVYNLILSGVFTIFTPFVSGVSAAFGDMIAKNEIKKLEKNLRSYEQVVFMLATFLFGVTGATILPFVGIYVKEVTDVNYIRPVFAYLFIAATFFRAIRVPYSGIAAAAGHFRRMRTPAFIEAGINIGMSVLLVTRFGISGVIVGDVFAFIYRTIRYATYISRNIIPRSIMIFVKRLILSAACVLTIAVIPYALPLREADTFYFWVLNALIIAVIASLLVVAVEVAFYRKDLAGLLKTTKSALTSKRSTL